jgi:hypothetical protein
MTGPPRYLPTWLPRRSRSPKQGSNLGLRSLSYSALRLRLAAPLGIEPSPPRSKRGALPARQRGMIGQRGWIRTTDLLRPRQAGTAQLPYTLMTGAHGRTRTCTSLVRNQALYPVELRVR